VRPQHSGSPLDNRVSCAVQIEVMRRLKASGTPHTVYFVFTVQEEVGSRGTQPAAYGLDPHFGIALDVTPTGDTPKNPLTAVELGKGTAIKMKDVGLIVPAAVRELMIQRAEEAGILYQLEVLDLGSQDGRMIQIARSGVPTGAVAVPVRYVHTRSETADRRDIVATVDLVTAILSQPIEL
ncbi:MAG TPA: M20/M25/M40 family metallo-hydrolase, partial [Aggregatilineaceae bacterium]|nr:M20/M25/M40 family metallo-hydrolase [Aggregatilineaceae bacterium]